MTPTKAVIILLLIVSLIGGIFYFLYTKNGSNGSKGLEGIQPASKKTENIINSAGSTTAEKKLEAEKALIEAKVQEKIGAIEAKPAEVLRTEGYTQAELDFIANPQREAAEELGIKPAEQPAPAKVYSQSELDDIANPKK